MIVQSQTEEPEENRSFTNSKGADSSVWRAGNERPSLGSGCSSFVAAVIGALLWMISAIGVRQLSWLALARMNDFSKLLVEILL